MFIPRNNDAVMGATSPYNEPARDGGLRFGFGANWARFLSVLNDERITEAERSLTAILRRMDLEGSTFLDIGSGSGLFSLAAKRLRATRVHSFDYDQSSVACTRELKRRYFDGDATWTIERGSALDADYMAALGRFDVVYSWGVLHHSGEMWRGVGLAVERVAPGGSLVLAIYNDQGGASRRWRSVKRLYNRLPSPLNAGLVLGVGAWLEFRTAAIRAIRGQNPLPFAEWKAHRKRRGMAVWHDLVDWVGGYPFEVAKPEEVFSFCRKRGLVLEAMTTCAGGYGCNEFVFTRPE